MRINALSEDELIRDWVVSENPVVSVICCTYNHELYIEDTLNGFLSQRTNFKFEIIVQNDASPDGTRDILDRYTKEYPNVLRVIHHDENQYSKGIKPSPLAIDKSEGEFIAMCEGDDYWIDVNKLQRQYDALQRHQEVDLCFHPSRELCGDKMEQVINNYFDEETIIPLCKVIEGRGGFMPTASLMIRKSVVFPFPDWFIQHAPVGDVFIQAIASRRGGALYLPCVMSVYRRFSLGSATSLNKCNQFSSDVLQKMALNYEYCYSQLSLKMSESSDAIALAKSEEIFSISVKALHCGDVELFKMLYDKSRSEVNTFNNLFKLAVFVSRYIPPVRRLILKRLNFLMA